MHNSICSASTIFSDGHSISFCETDRYEYTVFIDGLPWLERVEQWRARCFYTWLCSGSKSGNDAADKTWLEIYWDENDRHLVTSVFKLVIDVCENVLTRSDEDNAIAFIEAKITVHLQQAGNKQS